MGTYLDADGMPQLPNFPKPSDTPRSLIYLLSCALNGTPVDVDQARAMDLGQVLELARKHSVSALAAAPLLALREAQPDALGGEEAWEPWDKADATASRQYLLSTYEFEELSAWMEQQKVWHMPLKGFVLRDLYPSPHLRECGDVDVLFDIGRRNDVRTFMEGRGYAYSTFEHHDIYRKQPLLLFEMHLGLVDRDADTSWEQFYHNVRERLAPAPGRVYQLRFTDEEFYIFLVAHAAKHMREGGTGLRTLADFFVFNRAMGAQIDRAEIEQALVSLGLVDYERANHSLAEKLFDCPCLTPTLSAEEARLLDDILQSGTFGSRRTKLERQIGQSSDLPGGKAAAKLAYMLHRAFPPFENMSRYNSTLKAHPWMLPYFWARRIAGALSNEGKRSEINQVRKL